MGETDGKTANQRANLTSEYCIGNFYIFHKIQTFDAIEMRKDFVDIVRDLEKRAERFGAQDDDNSKLFSVVVDPNEQFLTITPPSAGSESESISENKSILYPLGSMVILRSAISEEDFCGIITAISFKDIVIRLGTGNRIRVYLNQLRDGRVSLSPEKDEGIDLELLSEAHGAFSFTSK